MGLDSIVSVDITTLTSSVAQAGFGTPLLAAYFPTSIFPERVRRYTSLTGMSDDGFPTSHPAYLMATALKAQSPSVPEWKVGRKANPSAQTLDITPTITTEGEVLRITVEGTEISYTILASATVATICTALAALLQAIVGVDASNDVTHVTITPNRVLSTRLTVDTPDDSQAFTVTINGTSYTYTSDTSGTVTEIRDGLKALIDADSNSGVTTTSVSTNALDITSTTEAGFEITETAGGSGAMSFSMAVDAYDLLSVGGLSTGLTVKDNTPDPGLSADLTAMESEDSAWYGLQIDSESEAEIAVGAAWAEARKVLFVPSCIDSEIADAGVSTDIGSDLMAAGYARTALIFAHTNQQYSGARWIGKMFPKDPGSATWSFKKLAGVTVSTLTGSQEGALNAKNVNHYQSIGGASITQKGYSASGEYIDITRGVDWFRARLQERFYSLLVNSEKIPFTNQSGDLFRAEILGQMEEALKRGILAPNTDDTPWVIDVPDVADISTNNKANRIFPDIEFSAYLAGAVHTIQISGTLSV